MTMMRGRGQRTVVRRLGNTAGLCTSPGAGPARGARTGPLTLSPSAVTPRRLVSGGVLAFVSPVSSFPVRTSRSVAVRPVRAGPSHLRNAGNHGLRFTGARTRGFGLGPFRLSSYLGFYSTEEDKIHKGATPHVTYPKLPIPYLLELKHRPKTSHISGLSQVVLSQILWTWPDFLCKLTGPREIQL